MLKRLKDEVCDEISEEVIINDIKPTEHFEKLILNNAVVKINYVSSRKWKKLLKCVIK